MSTTPDAPLLPQSEAPEEETFCYAHPKTPTKLRCSRCERPICGRCSIPASVGQHCPECVAEARRTTPKVRSALRATAPVVMVILIINVGVWLFQTILPAARGPYDIITFSFGAFPPAIADGQWYRLITPMFLHSPDGIWHIGLNSYALFIFGPNVEQAFGKAKFVAIYLISGFTGGALSYVLGPCNRIGVGASGAIFGVIGALFVFLYNRRQQTFVRGYLKNIIFLVGLNLVIGFALPGIDNLAHLGGLAGGALVAFGFDEQGPAMGPARRLMPAAVTILTVLLVLWRTTNFTCG